MLRRSNPQRRERARPSRRAQQGAPAAVLKARGMGGPGRRGAVSAAVRGRSVGAGTSRTTAAFSTVRRLRAQGCFPLSGSLSPREPRIFGRLSPAFAGLRTKEKPKPATWRRNGKDEGRRPPLRTVPRRRRPTHRAPPHAAEAGERIGIKSDYVNRRRQLSPRAIR